MLESAHFESSEKYDKLLYTFLVLIVIFTIPEIVIIFAQVFIYHFNYQCNIIYGYHFIPLNYSP